ncbi:twin-arginine translocase TatA/TatE family subunit [Candidatus Sumerlaeota bacterium]|nr:twin-arginine translocase TatA/TatE family subunit [Candidatus Sumerlaeota bacterium]
MPAGTELIVILIIVLILFGPKQLPKIGRALGGGIKEFKDGLKTGPANDDEEETTPESRTTIQAGRVEALPPSDTSPPEMSRERPAEQPSDQRPPS